MEVRSIDPSLFGCEWLIHTFMAYGITHTHCASYWGCRVVSAYLDQAGARCIIKDGCVQEESERCGAVHLHELRGLWVQESDIARVQQ